MWALFARVILLLCLYSDHIGHHFASGSSLSRSKRSRKRETDPIDFDNVDETLYGWEPKISTSCPANQYICRDRSYCFKKTSLCNKRVSCDDQSDEINSLCGYTTTSSVASTTTESAGGPTSLVKDTNKNETTGEHYEEASPSAFTDTLKIAFITIGVATALLGMAVSIYCTKDRFCARRQDANQVTPVKDQHVQKESRAA